MSSTILAFDLGTTGNKATVFDSNGRVAASAFSEYQTFSDRPLWSEQAAEDWWRSACRASKELIQRGVDPKRIAAVSMSGHMMGCLPVDSGGNPLHNSLIHSDGRSEKQCEQLRERVGDEKLYAITGNRIAPQYTLPKIAWFKQDRPDVFQKTSKFLQSKDYVVLKLTGGVICTDFSDASLSGLLDINQKAWSAELLDAIGIENSVLPQVVPSATVVGKVCSDAARETGLAEGTPVVIGGGDGACATAGAGALAPGEAYNYGGGTSWVSMVSEKPLIDPQMRIFNLLDLDPSRANVLGTMQAAGSSFEWFASEIGAFETAQESETGISRFQRLSEMAASSNPGSDKLFFLPYLMGERSPIWDSNARGVFFGLSNCHTRADMARAVLEGIAYALKSICDVLEELGSDISSLAIIGGMAKGEAFKSILASVLNKTLALPSNPGEATSRGAAIAGAVACGMLDSYADARAWVPVEGRVQPDQQSAGLYEEYYRFYSSLYPALKDRFREAALLP